MKTKLSAIVEQLRMVIPIGGASYNVHFTPPRGQYGTNDNRIKTML